MNPNSETLLDAIGGIDDKLIEEAAPQKVVHKKIIPWARYGSIAAGLCICILGIWMLSVFVGDSTKTESPAKSPQTDSVKEEACVEEEACAEEEAWVEEEAEEAPAEEAPVEEEAADGETLEEESPTDESAGSNRTENDEDPSDDMASIDTPTIDIAYGVTLNDRTYFPISFEERKQFGLLPEDATGLTPENTYAITDADLGAVMGTVSHSENTSAIGATAYHFAKYPDSDQICILEIDGTYEFYVCD